MGDDDSEELRKSAFLIAGLAGLGRITQGTRDELAGELAIDFADEVFAGSVVTHGGAIKHEPTAKAVG